MSDQALLLDKVLCFVMGHEWNHTPEDNHSRLVRECRFCLKKQEYHTGDSLAAPTGWWRDV